MVYVVEGLGRPFDYKNKVTQKESSARMVYVSRTAPNVDGRECEKIFLPMDGSIEFPDMKPGDQVDVFFNQRGFLDAIRTKVGK